MTRMYFEIMILVALTGLASCKEGAFLNRSRREGFGPWEAQETWDEKGKPVVYDKLTSMVSALVEEEKVFINQTMNFIHEVKEIIEHPVKELLRTKAGTVVLITLIVILIAGSFYVLVPILKVVARVACFFFGIFRKPLTGLWICLKSTACCMRFCALTPFVKVRNTYKAYKIRKDDKRRAKIYSSFGEEVEMVKKTYSRVLTDDTGVYLDAGNGHRVYLQQSYEVEDLLKMTALGGSKRVEEPAVSVVKETILTTSKLYKVTKLPDFQGQFSIDGTVVGHFSRIKYGGKDCIITAYHVLEYNRAGSINLQKDGKCVRLDTIRTRIVSASPSNSLDFIILEVPSFIFSTLGLKVGQWTIRSQPREPAMIYQLYKGEPCVASASISMSETKPWHIKYGASTIPGSSGAPILDARNQIIGIHLEHDVMLSCNVGVIPPVFRNSKKESVTNNDITQGENDPEEAYYEDDITEEEAERWAQMKEDEHLFFIAQMNYSSALDIDERPRDWATQMDEIDAAAEREFNLKYGIEDAYSMRLYYAKGKGGKKVQVAQYRKESPWTCSKCYTIHEHRGYKCVRCGFALVKGKVYQPEKETLAKEVVKPLPIVVQDLILSQVQMDQLVARITDQVVALLSAKESMVYKPQLYPDLRPTAPPVSMDTRLVSKLENRMANSWAEEPINGAIRAKKETTDVILTDTHYVLDHKASVEEGGCVLNPVTKNVIKVKPAGKSKSAARRQRKKEKETQNPLNSKAPAKTGAPTTSGAKKNPSPKPQTSSAKQE